MSENCKPKLKWLAVANTLAYCVTILITDVKGIIGPTTSKNSPSFQQHYSTSESGSIKRFTLVTHHTVTVSHPNLTPVTKARAWKKAPRVTKINLSRKITTGKMFYSLDPCRKI